jgi:PAS domain S-box-containing protein
VSPTPSDVAPFALDERAGLLDFWRVYKIEFDRVRAESTLAALASPDFGPIMRSFPPERALADHNRARDELDRAIVLGDWGPYDASMRGQGSLYAKLGVGFGTWYAVIRALGRALVPSLVEAYRDDPARLAGAVTAMTSCFHHAMTLVAEEYLRTKHEDRFRLLVDSVKDYAIIMLDANGLVTSWNVGAALLDGYASSEVLGHHFSIFFAEEDRESGEPARILEAAATSGRFEAEAWRVRKDGSRFWVHVNLTAVREPLGKLIGFARVTRDLTERMRAEGEREALVHRLEERGRQLEAANAELDGFTYSVSHDLRAPLRAIDGFARVLVEDHAPKLDEDGRRIVQVIEKNTRKMGQLIDDLLRFARLGRKEVQVGPVDMDALVRSVAEDVLEPGRSIDFRIAELPSIVGDLSLLRQVWQNLLSNAVKYTRPMPHAVIIVTGETLDDETIYRVKDNGVGFDPRYADKLFGVFQRLHSAAEFEGTGVGLALVQRIVQRHGGRVTAESQPGLGALFSFTLPKKDWAYESG